MGQKTEDRRQKTAERRQKREDRREKREERREKREERREKQWRKGFPKGFPLTENVGEEVTSTANALPMPCQCLDGALPRKSGTETGQLAGGQKQWARSSRTKLEGVSSLLAFQNWGALPIRNNSAILDTFATR